MKMFDVEYVVAKIQNYLRQSTTRPFFIIADGAVERDELKKHFNDLAQIYVSDFCAGDLPLDLDALLDKLFLLDSPAIVYGIGEYIYFTGQARIFPALQNKNFPQKVVFLCRGIHDLIVRSAADDSKFSGNYFCAMSGEWNLSVLKRSPEDDADAKNFTEFLRLVEQTARTQIGIVTSLPLLNTIETPAPEDTIQREPPRVADNSSLEKEKLLDFYLAEFKFGDATLTEYFQQYKTIKLRNLAAADFVAKVRELADQRPFNEFETRQSILDRLNNSSAVKLYWLDALGVEFLSFITAYAAQIGLVTKIEIARADLPTLTTFNRTFYDEWLGDKFDKNPKLDELKHTPEKILKRRESFPEHYILSELKIIGAALEAIRCWLRENRRSKVILTSDHGASRLAVMFGRSIKYSLQSVGEHGGRCCRVNDIDDKPPYSATENGYWVLADYGKIVGGRLSSVEVHGGATLEEVLVPVIELFNR